MKKILIILLVAGIGIYNFAQENSSNTTANLNLVQNNQKIINAYKNRQSDIQVNASGTVTKLLRDDTKGSKHQRFIVRVSPSLTILIAHNIDLAPKINSLKKGDIVEFYGEYEYNNKGGVVHWTHHDPRGNHIGGWLKHNGQTYQ